jgi:PadR family transcriptional regulator PadR
MLVRSSSGASTALIDGSVATGSICSIANKVRKRGRQLGVDASVPLRRLQAASALPLCRAVYWVNLHCIRTLCRLTTMGKEDRHVRMSLQTLRVLEVFLENPTAQLSGADVHESCGIASGTLYPILLRLEAAGWFVSRWESIDPSSAGRPRRRLYRLTSTGLKRASEVFASFSRGVLT